MSYNNKTKKYEGYIYCITNSANNKKYIGQTIRDISIRFKGHLKNSKQEVCDTYFHQAIKKYGCEKFMVEQIDKVECDTKDSLLNILNNLESMYIEKLNTLRPNGYNTSVGGNNLPNTFQNKKVYKFDLLGNYLDCYESMSEASRNNDVQQSDISKCCNGIINSAKGFIWSFTKEINRVVKYFTTPIDVYDLEGNFIETLISVNDGGKYTSIDVIPRICKGKGIQSNGYIFRYYGEPFDKYKTKDCRTRPELNKRVIQYTKAKQMIKTYNSIQEASNETGADPSGISKCCRGKSKSCYGYVWEYA